MKFDWSEFTEDDFKEAMRDLEFGDDVADNYYGCVRIGEICIDIVMVHYDGNELQYDFYIGGEDTGYGYSGREAMEQKGYASKYDVPDDELYPYDYDTGGWFDPFDIRGLNYEAFQSVAEREFLLAIATSNYTTDGGMTLWDKARMPLHKW